MGKCLSCCDDEQRRRRRHRPSTPNGHGPSGAVTSLPSAQRATVLLEPPPPACSPPPPTAAAAPPAAAATNNQPEKKMFVAYTKLPPIRKPGSGSGGGAGGVGAALSAGSGASGLVAAASDPKRSSRDISEQKIHALFEEYKDPEEEEILADGVERFCEDLNVKPEDFRMLVLAWTFDAQQMCMFTRGELVDGCKKLQVDSIKGIQARLPDLVKQVQGKEDFKLLYRWTYKFGLETGQRTLPTEVAIVLWKLVFSKNEPPMLSRWLDFLATHPSIRGIPKDTWDMLLNLTEAVGDDLSTYDDTEAWPSLFDDFVEYENDRQNQNVTDKDIKSGC